MSTKQLAERRANLWSQMQGIMADAERDSRDLTAEERETWDRLEADLSALTSDMDRFQRSADLQRGLEAPIETELDAAGEGTRQDDAELTERAFAEYLRRGIDGIDPAQASFDMMHRMFGTPLALPLRASRPMQSVQSLQQHAPTRRADRPASV